MLSDKQLLEQFAGVLRRSSEIIKQLQDDNKTLRLRTDTLDLLSCFMLAKVPEPKSQGYGADPIWEINRLLEQHQEIKNERELKKIKLEKKKQEKVTKNVRR